MREGRLFVDLKRRFSPTRYLRTRHDLELLRPGGRHAEWVIGRGLTMFTSVACSAVPKKRREAFVGTAVRRLAPFADPRWYVAWGGDVAMVWIWPGEELFEPDFLHRTSPDMQGDSRLAVRKFLPESLLRGSPRDRGLELIQCSDGFEGRAWRNHVLVACNWWPNAPDPGSWIAFCRGAGFAPDTGIVPQQEPWRDEPWTANSRGAILETLSDNRRHATTLAVAVACLIVSVQLGGLGHLWWSNMRLRSQIDSASSKVSDILAARDSADSDLARIKALRGLRPPATQFELLSTVTALLDRKHAQLLQWSMPNPQTVEVLVTMRSPDPRGLVLEFQKSKWFRDVSADVGRGGPDQLVIRASVTSDRGVGS